MENLSVIYIICIILFVILISCNIYLFYTLQKLNNKIHHIIKRFTNLSFIEKIKKDLNNIHPASY